MTNHNNAKRLISSDSQGFDTSYLVGHIYQAGDPQQFTIGVGNEGGEAWGSVVAYRAANSNLSAYAVYGYANTVDTRKINTGNVTVNANNTLVNLFISDAFTENNEGSEENIYSAPTGGAVAETPST